ncbi:unnamed protein product, partial [Adineta steineri]
MLQSINTNRGEQQKPDETKLDKRLDDLEKTIKGLDESMKDEDKKRKQRP